MAIHKRVLDCVAALAMTMVFLIASPLAAQTFPPRPDTPVLDQANILRPEQELDLQSKAEALYAQTGRAFVVATVNSLEGRTIADYGYRLLRTWGVGQKGKDDGVILLVAPNEKKVRIETGYGARVFLTDAMASFIVREAIVPRFKAGDMGGGVVAGANEIIKQMSLPPDQAQRTNAQAEQRQQQRQNEGGGGLPMIFWLMIIGFVVLSMMRRSRGRRYRGRRGYGGPIILWGPGWGGGGFGGGSWGGGFGGGGGGFGGGGFGGFGGGSGGGGGASGSW